MDVFGELERLIDDIYPYRWLIAALVVVALALLAAAGWRQRWHLALWRHKLRTALVVVPLLIVAIPLSYYLLSPLWTRTTIYEESPLASPAIAGAGAPDVATRPAAPTPTATATTDPTVPVTTPTSPPAATPEPVMTTELEPLATPTAEPPPVPTVEPTPEPFTPRLVSSGPLDGADEFHFAEGTALLIETAPGLYVLRLEAFSVRNGPDLFVYLARSPDELDDSAINLGGLRATDGSINYDVPPGTDIAQYQSVVIWCRAFSVLFGSAPLIAA